MILVDTSAWVKYDRATGSLVDQRLTSLIGTSDQVAVTEPVVMEVLAGARDDRREQDLRRLLNRFHLIRFDPVVHFDSAVRIYRTCRRAGVTPRGMVDCMIAAVAMATGTPVLAQDRDLDEMATVVNPDPKIEPGTGSSVTRRSVSGAGWGVRVVVWGLGGGFDGDLVAEGFELVDVSSFAAFGIDAFVVKV